MVAPKYPDITVDLSGEDGHAMRIIALVRKAMVDAACPEGDVKAYIDAAMADDYDHLLRVSAQTVCVTGLKDLPA